MGMFDCRGRRAHAGEKADWITQHQYDPESGWCWWRCGCRNDGRVIGTDGRVLREGPAYTREQLDDFRQWLDRRHPRRSQPRPAGPDLFDALEAWAAPA